MKTAYVTRRCPVCYKTGVLMVEESELLHYLQGNLVQNSFKTMSASLREQIISGTHPECWESIFETETEETYND